jgi:hypothetical protein
VVRLAARTRESVSSSVDHLCLHTMVRALDAPDKAEQRKLQQLKDELGELVSACLRACTRGLGCVGIGLGVGVGVGLVWVVRVC